MREPLRHTEDTLPFSCLARESKDRSAHTQTFPIPLVIVNVTTAFLQVPGDAGLQHAACRDGPHIVRYTDMPTMQMLLVAMSRDRGKGRASGSHGEE